MYEAVAIREEQHVASRPCWSGKRTAAVAAPALRVEQARDGSGPSNFF